MIWISIEVAVILATILMITVWVVVFTEMYKATKCCDTEGYYLRKLMTKKSKKEFRKWWEEK